MGENLIYCRDPAKDVGWVERSETQQQGAGVGFRTSTQPTKASF
jgi:hypothetical protein